MSVRAYTLKTLLNNEEMRKFLILIIVVLLQVSSYAQNVEFIDYSKYPSKIMQSLNEAQKEKPFLSIPDLKKQCITAKNEEAITYNNLPKAQKKPLSSSNLVKERKPSTLIVCKVKRGYGMYEDFVLVGASAIALSEDGLCASNYHVFEYLINEGQSIMPQDSLFFIADSEGNAYEIETVYNYSKSADLAVFKINTRGEKLIPTPLGNDLAIGTDVHTISHPNQELYYYTKGVVARHVAYEDNPWENRTEITADFAIGSSGGPVYDSCGNLVSVISSTNSVYAGGSEGREWQMVMKICIPVSSLKKLINS